MACAFFAIPDPSAELCAEVAAFAPTNPFYTPAYIESRRALGFQPWVLSLRQEDRLLAVCPVFMKSRYWQRSCEIPSLPTLSQRDVFWGEFLQLCRQVRVSLLNVNSAAAPGVWIPALPGQTQRRTRYEYILDLQQPGLWDRLSSNHVRNIKRGRNVGLQVRRAVDEQACREHSRLVEASLERRRSRGETVPENIQTRSFVTYTQKGTGELFQAVRDGKVLSSILVLLAEQGAYYQSAGTSSEGMACGASPFLVYEIATILQNHSLQVFNLGGANQPDSGLGRFKAGFATNIVQLEAADFFLGGKTQKAFRTIARFVRNHSCYLFQHMPRRLERAAK